MADVVTFGADATEYLDVVARMQEKLDELSAKHDLFNNRLGSQAGADGFLRSERIVSRSTANMVTGLFQAQNAADAVAAALLTVERSGKIGFGLAIGGAVAIAGYEAAAKAIEEVKKVDDDLAKAMGRPLIQEAKLDASGLDKEIGILAPTIEAKIKEAFTFKAALLNTYKDGFQNLAESAGEAFKIALDPIGAIFEALQHPVTAVENIIKPGKGGAFGSKGTDADFAAIEKAQERLNELSTLRGKAELAIANAKDISLHESELEGEVLKINAEYAAKEGQAILDAKTRIDQGGSSAGLSDTLKGLREEKALAIEVAQAKAFNTSLELDAADKIAQFRGTAEQKTVLALQSALETAQTEKNIADEIGNQTEQKKAQLAVDKAQEAIAQHQLELRKQAVDLKFNAQEIATKVQTAQAVVGLGPEDAQRTELEAQVKLAQDLVDKAKELLAIDADDAGNKKALTDALGNQAIAAANLAKFENEAAFKDAEELNAAKAATAELDAQAHGEKFLADLISIRATAEAKITAALRDQKGELAQQEALQAKIALDQAVGRQALRTSEQINQDAATARQAAFETTVGEKLIDMLRQDVAHGAKLDATQQKILDADNAIKDAVKDPKGPKDPPEIAQLKTLNATATAILVKIGGNPVQQPPEGGGGGGGPNPESDPRQRNTTLSQPHDWTEFDKWFHPDRFPPPGGEGPSDDGKDSGIKGLADLDFSSLESLSGDDFSSIESLNSDDFSSLESLSGGDFSSLIALGAADFSSLNELAGMDFSGLAPLNGFTISIQ